MSDPRIIPLLDPTPTDKEVFASGGLSHLAEEKAALRVATARAAMEWVLSMEDGYGTYLGTQLKHALVLHDDAIADTVRRIHGGGE